MSWRNKDDLGLALVAKVHDQLRVQDQWLIDCGRGFAYWPSDFATSISADPPNFHNAYSIFRLNAETEIARGKIASPSGELAVARRMRQSALSALTYDEKTETYKLHCSVFAHADNADWLGHVFLGAVGLQIGRACATAKWLSQELGLEPARSPHPTAGYRKTPDPVATAIDQFFIPCGKQPSRWDGSPEWEDAFRVIRRMGRHCESDEKTFIRSEFDWLAEAPISMSISAQKGHPTLGNGLLFELKVPWTEEASERSHTASLLNDMERQEWNWCHDLGVWCLDDEELAFVCFVPNVSYHEGCLTDLTHDMALRARWMNEVAGLAAMGVTVTT